MFFNLYVCVAHSIWAIPTLIQKKLAAQEKRKVSEEAAVSYKALCRPYVCEQKHRSSKRDVCATATTLDYIVE